MRVSADAPLRSIIALQDPHRRILSENTSLAILGFRDGFSPPEGGTNPERKKKKRRFMNGNVCMQITANKMRTRTNRSGVPWGMRFAKDIGLGFVSLER